MMSQKTMWMARGESGRLYDELRERGIVAIGWWEMMDWKPGESRSDLAKRFVAHRPEYKRGTIISGASQVWRFINEIREGDLVLTYSPSLRKYLVGEVVGPAKPEPELRDTGIAISRKAKWLGEVDRDVLSVPTKNSLGSTLTVFKVPSDAANDIMSALNGKPKATPPLKSKGIVEDEEDEDSSVESQKLLEDTEARGRSFIEDRVSKLAWDDMQELIAGILRAMGYKTRIAKAGPDRGADIFASPDGLGFETPRIVVEVKHRQGSMGSKEVRSFLGGRHKDDRGLYVSTGGFSKDARYEADRASIPVTLWELEDIVRYLVEYYDQLDSETRQLVPLKRIYWPA